MRYQKYLLTLLNFNKCSESGLMSIGLKPLKGEGRCEKQEKQESMSPKIQRSGL